jgi:acetylornithine aminotransferase/acetylornithine/N-succinyldiaminopimelate aminotransferase
VLRFLPPYILEKKHIELAIDALDEILKANTELAGAVPAGEKVHG